MIFPFTASQGGESESFELSNDGFCLGFPFVGNNFQIVEEPVPDWVLDRVECDSGSSAITYLPDGLSLDCVEGLDITCEFINIYRPTENVPTLSEWSMITAAAGLALVGVFFALRRKRMMHEA